MRIKWINVWFRSFSNRAVAVPSGVDNPVFDGMFNYCRLYCGASLGMVYNASDDSLMLLRV